MQADLPPILIDTREKAPYTFLGLRDHVTPTRSAHLRTGDYSLDGLTNLIAVERKALTDLFGTVLHRRRAFVCELARLARLALGAVVVEAPFADITLRPPTEFHLSSAIVKHFIREWRQKYPAVRWYFTDSRRAAERLTLDLLERFWRTMTVQHTPQPIPSWESLDHGRVQAFGDPVHEGDL